MNRLPIVSIVKRFTFDSAHRLTGVPDDHPCKVLHGHTYTVEVEVKGSIDQAAGWLIDYREIKRIVKPFVDQLDHKFLNDIDGLHYTTAEEIAVWFWERIKPELPELSRVGVMETSTSGCDFYGDYGD